jgi:hypothetical protein
MQYEVTLKILLDSPCKKERVTHQVESLFEFGTIRESFVDALGLDETPRLSRVSVERASTGRNR